MGREIRMVPPNWDHPRVMRGNGELGYKPMYRGTFEDAAADWKDGYEKWQAGERPEWYTPKSNEYWEYAGNPPQREDYEPWNPEEATWFQVWETVSEGTPVSPPFATREELIEYLVKHGDFWDQSRRHDRAMGRDIIMNCDPWTRKQAEAFVNGPGWAPSMIADSKGLRSGVEALGDGAV